MCVGLGIFSFSILVVALAAMILLIGVAVGCFLGMLCGIVAGLLIIVVVKLHKVEIKKQVEELSEDEK